MKKNFVKKLALGLALVMAVTSVPTTSEAASKPAFKTASVEVKEGETVKAVVKGTKGYTVKKVASKDETVATVAKVAQKAKKTNVKVTGVKAGETTVVAKLAKGGKTVKAKLAVTVKAEEKTTMTVEATGAKKLVVSFNNAVDKTKAVLKVTKGTSTPNFTPEWAADNKSVTLNMGSKLTKGTYTVTVTALTEEALTATVDVEDEVLKAIEFIGNNLIITDAGKGNGGADPMKATIAFKAVNQYGERVAVDNLNAVSTFGSVANSDIVGSTTKKNGTITVTIPDTSSVLQILGTSGSVTIIEKTKGITATAEVVLSAEATASSMNIAGMYNKVNREFADMVRGANASDYAVLVQFKDQYGNVLALKDLDKANLESNFVAAGTGVAENPTWTEVTVGDETYIAISFTGVATVGTMYFTFVNKNLGLLANAQFTVSEATVAQTVNIYAESEIYNKQRNELGYEVVDKDGNVITKYSVLKDVVVPTTAYGSIGWEKQSDGTAKLIYIPSLTFSDATNKKETGLDTVTANINNNVVTSKTVKIFSFTVKEEKVATEVVGLVSGTPTAIVTNGDITVRLSDFIIEDQYANPLNVKEKAFQDAVVNVTAGSITVTGTIDKSTISLKNPGVTFKAGNKETETVKFGLAGQKEPLEVVYSITATDRVSNIKIKSINRGVVYNASPAAVTYTDPTVVITAEVGGKVVTLPASQYAIIGNTIKAIDFDKEGYQTKTATLTVAVQANGETVELTGEYSYSNAPASAVSVEATNEKATISAGTDVTTGTFESLFTFTDQYGKSNSMNLKGVKYEVIDMNDTEVKNNIWYSGYNNATIKKASSSQKYRVIATVGEVSATVDVTIQ